jgi:hypothetical protein
MQSPSFALRLPPEYILLAERERMFSQRRNILQRLLFLPHLPFGLLLLLAAALLCVFAQASNNVP